MVAIRFVFRIISKLPKHRSSPKMTSSVSPRTSPSSLQSHLLRRFASPFRFFASFLSSEDHKALLYSYPSAEIMLRTFLLLANLLLVAAFVSLSTTQGRLLERHSLSALPKGQDEGPSRRLDRRDWLQQASAAAALATSLSIPLSSAQAIDVSGIPTTSSPSPTSLPPRPATTTTTTTTTTFLDPDQAKITDKVFFDVRISRQDGTFYVRDDLPDTPENRVFLGRLTLGLFGEAAPNHVQRFKSYMNPTADPLDDNPLPNYGRSVFASLDQVTGLLTGGRIPALEVTSVNGSPALRYGGRLLSSSLWIDAPPRLSHTSRGLLTHRQLETLPLFGITTRTDTHELDSSYTVFGKVLFDESATEFFDIVRDLPTYSMERPVVSGDSVGSDPSLVEESARAVFAAQRNFFRSTAKAFGDTRLDKVYEGKLLRRVEVTRVGFL